MAGSLLTTQVVSRGDGALELDAAELRVTRGQDQGLEFALSAATTKIGTSPDCDLVLHDPTVSSFHAEVVLDNGGYLIRDLGSKNGILLGGWRVEAARLADRMLLSLGSNQLQVVALVRKHIINLAAPETNRGVAAHSIKMRAVLSDADRFAATDTTVLIEGETGAGKEVMARWVHQRSPRATGPFIVCDCGATNANLIGAELFGYEKGAFTDAADSRPGLFEEADGGTLFLDEIGELPLEEQRVFLRALETKSTRRVGGSKTQKHDIRVVAATNRNLAEQVKLGTFRQDLYFRLAVGRIRIPPLRERREDIPVLAHGFAKEFGTTLSREMLAALAAYDWPGNVRELRNAIERAAMLPGVTARDLLGEKGDMADATELEPLNDARRKASDDFEKSYLVRLLTLCEGNVSQASKKAGVSRQYLTRLIAKYGLQGQGR